PAGEQPTPTTEGRRSLWQVMRGASDEVQAGGESQVSNVAAPLPASQELTAEPLKPKGLWSVMPASEEPGRAADATLSAPSAAEPLPTVVDDTSSEAAPEISTPVDVRASLPIVAPALRGTQEMSRLFAERMEPADI